MGNKNTNRFWAIMLIFSFLLMLTSCEEKLPVAEKTTDNGKYISADSPWYYGEVIEVDLGLDDSREINYMFPTLIGADDKYAYIFVNGEYITDYSLEPENSEFAIKNIIVVDKTTKQVSSTINLWSVLEDYGGYPEHVVYSNDMLIAKCFKWIEEDNSYIKRDYYIDPDTAQIIDYVDYEETGTQYCDSFVLGEYRIETWHDYFNTPTYSVLKVFAPDGSETDIEIKDIAVDYYEIPTILALDDTTALIPVPVAKGYKYFKLDLTSLELTECNQNDYEWLDLDKLLDSYCSPTGEVYYTSDSGVSKIDLENETDEQVFDFSWSDVNRYYLTNLEIVYGAEDSFLLCGQYDSPDMFSSQFVKNYAIVEFTKADTNPHAGKQIIELLAADGDINAAVSDAIVEFNNESADYYIEISDRYELSDYTDYSDINSEDDYESALLNASADMSSELAVDIINGEGPDIILNASGLSQLNSDDYLVDLSAYLTDLDEDKYFYNIIEEAKTDDKLYQLPICITLEGIQTDPSYAGSTGVGFTTDEYEEFLDKTLNGSDVIEYGQALYLAKLFNGMNDKFISEGKIDITGSEYAELAEFVKDNVIEMSQSWSDESVENGSPEEYSMGKNWQTAYYCNCPSISGYLVKRDQIKNGTAILGIPSTDGRGPLFGANISVAVSSQAVDIDACVEFVRILLSDEIQSKLAYRDMLVINRDALTEACNAAIDFFDTETGSQNVFDYAQGTYVSVQTKFTSEDIDNLFDAIESCSGMSRSDAAISIIIIEEMPPYFLGQKDLESVVAIIQDRAQTVLDER